MIRFHAPPIAIEERLTRPAFEAMIAPDLTRVRETMRRVVVAAGCEPEGIDAVFITGGSAQIPAVQALFVEAFGHDRLRSEDFLTSVASGLGRAALGAA